MESSKMIVIKTKGRVETGRGRVYAPIKTPYRETVRQILHILTVNGADVWEVLPDKTEVQLTTSNYDKNNAKKPEPRVEQAPPSAMEEVPELPLGTVSDTILYKGDEKWTEETNQEFMNDLKEAAINAPEAPKEVTIELKCNGVDMPGVDEAAADLMEKLHPLMGKEELEHEEIQMGPGVDVVKQNNSKKHGKNRNKNRNNRPVEATIPEEVE